MERHYLLGQIPDDPPPPPHSSGEATAVQMIIMMDKWMKSIALVTDSYYSTTTPYILTHILSHTPFSQTFIIKAY